MKRLKRTLCSVLALMILLSVLPLHVLAEEATDDLAAAAGDVAINETNFPDPIFRDYVSENFDSDHNGILSQAERDGAQYVNVRGKSENPGSLTSLKGIEFFANLTSINCDYNQVTVLDVSANTKLEALSCVKNQLTALDVSKNIQLQQLHCYNNQLASLDLSNNTKLEWLRCGSNQLTALDVSQNTRLEDLDCYNNRITALDLRKNTRLCTLYCNQNQLTSLDLSNNTALEHCYAPTNSYSVQANSDGTVDLSTLPGEFDVTKATNWIGGTVQGNTLTFQNNIVTYTYDCGKGFSETFTLLRPGYERVYGADRYKTAFKAADELKEVLGISKFQNIIVACGTNFPDALSGTYLAAQKKAPILLVRDSNIAEVNDYIKNNLVPGGTLYLLGSNDVLSDKVGSGISGINVKRLGGATRYDTNLLILKEAGVGQYAPIIVCTGKNFADSLSASAIGLPILLVKDSLTQAQKDFLATTIGFFYIVGGQNAVSTTVENQLTQIGYGQVTRVAGSNRYETSVKVAEFFFYKPVTTVLAYAQNFPDGLAAGPLAYFIGAPLILTANGKEAAVVNYTTGLGIQTGYVLGGTGLISDNVARKVFSLG